MWPFKKKPECHHEWAFWSYERSPMRVHIHGLELRKVYRAQFICSKCRKGTGGYLYFRNDGEPPMTTPHASGVPLTWPR